MCFRLEWDRGTMNASDLAVKFTSYAHYITSREWAHELRNEVTEELISDMGMKIVEDGTVRSEETREPEGEPIKRAKGERNGGPSGKRGHRVPLGEASVRGKGTAVGSHERRSSCCQTERGSKVCWDAAQSDSHLPSCGNANMASQPLLKRQPIMRSLRTGQGCR
jgi:hypothetical protein